MGTFRRVLAATACVLYLAFPAWGQVASRDFELSETDKITINGITAALPSHNTGTIALWVKLESNSVTQVAHGTGLSTDNVPYSQFQINSSNKMYFQQASNPGTGSSWSITQVDNSLSTGTWYFMAVVQNASAPVLYFNGIADSATVVPTGSATGAEWYDDRAAAGDPDRATIGLLSRTTDILPFDGLIAYLQWYSTSLSAAEIMQIMHCPGSVTNGLVGYWPLTDSTTQYDHSVNSNNGTNNGTAASTDGPPIGGCSGSEQSIGVQ